jgi:hypothetical protein
MIFKTWRTHQNTFWDFAHASKCLIFNYITATIVQNSAKYFQNQGRRSLWYIESTLRPRESYRNRLLCPNHNSLKTIWTNKMTKKFQHCESKATNLSCSRHKSILTYVKPLVLYAKLLQQHCETKERKNKESFLIITKCKFSSATMSLNLLDFPSVGSSHPQWSVPGTMIWWWRPITITNLYP